MNLNNEQQTEAYKKWKKDPTPENLNNILTSLKYLLQSEVSKYQGTLDPKLLEIYAKKYAIDAIKSYNEKVQLSTHIVNNMQRLHRLNYQNVQGVKSPEEIQGKFNDYVLARQALEDEFNRTPTDEEISEKIGYDVNKIKKYIRYEKPVANMLYSSQHTETSPEDEAIDLLYYDSNDIEKTILEHKTGYNGAKILTGKEISKKLKLSPVRVTQISENLGKKLYNILYNREQNGFI